MRIRIPVWLWVIIVLETAPMFIGPYVALTRPAFMGGPEHMGADKSAYFDANPSLYLENFPPMLGQPEGLHQALLS